ncbi:winged helix-turn-helix domain-containing protein [Priestia megaterium]|uniref:winged helix-turn-helix domain-containing protein n=1 Tax=Priestia megaterium TaxID=1404 RepID=UPI00244842F3|nr:winged helix-turn-helix domain-containing protein [Priestia megaterium]MDH2363453.1 winged helix-turn-helix domain-containing protein [Priestia megaterium]
MQDFLDANDTKQHLHDAIGFEESPICEITRRIVIISKVPTRILPLAMELMVLSYDVFVLHNQNDPVLATLQSDLVIIDHSKTVADEPLKTPSHLGSVLLLVVDGHWAKQDSNEHELLIWPCPVPEAVKKISQIINQTQALPRPYTSHLRYKNITLDLKQFSVYKSGVKVELTKNEFNLLNLLISGGGTALTRDEIVDQLCGEDYFGSSNFVDVHIKSLRSKLEDDRKKPTYILTVRGVGYRISN